MTDQWEKYVEAAGDAMLDCDHNGIQCYTPKPIDETARAVLAAVGPLIAEDTRVRMVEAAGRAVERETSDTQCREAFTTAINELEKEARWQIEQMRRDPEEEWGHSVQRLNVVANCLRQIGGLT